MENREKLDPKGGMQLPAIMIPSFRSALAAERGVDRKILFKTWGGIGDQICAEPTIRWAMETIKGCEFYLASELPELFTHLPFKRVFDLKEEQPLWDNYFVFDSIFPPSHLQWEFMSHMLINAVDYVSLCMFRCQLPVKAKQVQISYDKNWNWGGNKSEVVIHPGKHWPSKTFPKDWWDAVISGLVAEKITPVLIGANSDENRGTVDVNPTGCMDLRNELSIPQSIALLNTSTKVLLTNDSSPLHMAVPGNAHIGFVATCKHPDYIMHWRMGGFGWRMQNLGLGGVWDIIDYCPNKKQNVTAEFVEEDILRSWLPDPKFVVDWTLGKLFEN